MIHKPKNSLYREATRVALLGIAVNLVLGSVKLWAGWAGESFALLSDAVNSFSDVGISLALFYALWLAQRPPDKEHPYGHTRAEGVAGLTVAMLVTLTAGLIGWEALHNLGEDQAIPANWTIAVALSNLAIKEGLYHYSRAVARRTNSTAVAATAWDHRADALCSLVVLVGLVAAIFGGERWAFADDLAGMGVAVLVMLSGIRLFAQAGHELLDAQADPALVREIRQVANQVAGVRDVETLLVRKSGLEYFADIHVEVDGDLTVVEGHRIGHRVKDHLLQEFPQLRDVLVHVEPHNHAKEHRSLAPEEDLKISPRSDRAKA